MAIKDIRAVYAGSQLQAAGVLALASDTRRLLVIKRSHKVTDPNGWCGAGGKIEPGESERQAAVREFQEETGILSEVKVIPLLVYNSPSLKFSNFLGVVEAEHYPHLNWESSGYAWVTLDEIPSPRHFGLQAILDNVFSMGLIRKLIACRGDLWTAGDIFASEPGETYGG